ncbi:flippase [Geobacter sp. DSM 9736]|uniref:flippase n=1 Tax=Geobacter sp. DSM 9736 TaxID=1277350 RepID=UPI000B621AAB|nr:flippase [Geobacter sp. DSM 9736]SNB46134.1 Membrane protein involved in the export of O-antigen and teichoic acid [Geobacter sp. DSM 9736]
MEEGYLSRFIKGILTTGFGTLVTLILGFMNIGIAARYIPKEQFGVFLLMQTIVYSLIMVGDLGLNLSATKFLAVSREGERQTVINTIMVMRTAIAIAAVALILLCRNQITFLFKSEILEEFYVYIPLLFLLESYNLLFSSMLQGFHHYRKMAYAQMLASVTNVILIIVLIVFLGNGILGLVCARAVALVFSIVYQIRGIGMGLSFRGDRKLLKGLFGFGLPLGLNNVLSFIFMRFDTLIIGALLAPVSVALYGTAMKLPDAFRQMFESFRSVFFPNMAELFDQKRMSEAESVLNNSLRLISFATLFVTLGATVFQKEIVTLLFSAKYIECAPVLSVLMLAMSIGLIGYVLGTSLVSAGYSKLPVIINIVDTAVTLTANLIMIPRFGIIGAAYASVLARTVSNPVNLWFLKRAGIDVKAMEYIKPIAAYGICCALLSVLGNSLLPGLAALSLYLVLCAGTTVIRGEDLLNLKRIIRMNTQPANVR